ncbi:MAG: hypothetical protein LH481_05830 [Burkholderiales bacterium]|nr:hypothetical protein [Burkholderiales bacterium]
MRHRTILEYRDYRYLKLAVLVVAAVIFAYGWYTYPLGHYGGTPLGYTLGTIGALLIFWLMWLGVQKRRYRTTGDVKGWLSAHIYLGTSLIIIATLHAGFQVGWNVHTLAYVLMMIVIASGFYGVYTYLRFPSLMTENLAEDTLESLTLKIADIDREARRLALGMSDEVNQAVLASIQKTRIGGGVYAQLRERVSNCPTASAVKLIKSRAGTVKGDAARKHQDLYGMMLRKERLVARARTDIRYKAIMDIWLFFHVPLSVALIAALVAHIVAVFFYW